MRENNSSDDYNQACQKLIDVTKKHHLLLESKIKDPNVSVDFLVDRIKSYKSDILEKAIVYTIRAPGALAQLTPLHKQTRKNLQRSRFCIKNNNEKFIFCGIGLRAGDLQQVLRLAFRYHGIFKKNFAAWRQHFRFLLFINFCCFFSCQKGASKGYHAKSSAF